MPVFSIRPYQTSDENAIIEITYKTGYMGEDLTGRRYCDDVRLWFMIFIFYYVHSEPEHFFVAVDTESNSVVGFICGTPDTLTQEVMFRKKMVPRIFMRLIGYTIWRYPRSFMTIWGMYRHHTESTFDAEIKPIITQYPAHLHINMLPKFQGQGMGTKLIKRFETHMKGLGTKGIHLGTTNKNFKAVPFYYKMGFELLHESNIVPHAEYDDLRELIFAKKL
jgi:ribosomal protein S18 acetylase RimI-like enzyme